MNLALELSEIEKQVSDLISENIEYKKQLTKAKEIIREIMKYDIPTLDYEKAEQFLKEI